MKPDDSKYTTVPVGRLGIIVHPSCEALGKSIDSYIVNWRKDRDHDYISDVVFKDYGRDSYLIKANCPRFGTGEAKGFIAESVRGVDLYIIADVLNYSLQAPLQASLLPSLSSCPSSTRAGSIEEVPVNPWIVPSCSRSW